IVESQRSKVGSAQLRALYFSAKREFYELHVDLLMDGSGADDASLALEASEQARARSLVDLLRESGIAIREGVDPDLLAREDALKQRIDVLESSRVRAMSDRPNPTRLATIEKDIEALFQEYDQVQGAIRTSSPRYAALKQGGTVRAADIQAALDEDTVVLEYLLGDTRSHLWIVTRSSLTSAALPPRREIEQLARDVYAGLTADAAGRRTGLTSLAEKRAALSHLLLAPAAALLDTRRIVIVADGALLYVPFGLLDRPAGSTPPRGETPSSGATRSGSPRPGTPRALLADHEVIHLPSMSSLLAMRDAPSRSSAAPGSVGIMADPVFSADDGRLQARGRSASSASASPAPGAGGSSAAPATSLNATPSLERAASDSGIVRFSRLRFTREEADRIAALVPADRRAVHTDFGASRAVAASEAFGRHQVLHFATHGLINGVHPDLSGLVFSLVDAEGRTQDGFLRLHDIYNLRLQSDVVVLSACQTALGQDVRGEGLIGLTRGFMYAGASRIVASLWDVDDRATAVLMERFYRELLVRKQRPAEALRRAQLALMADRRWSHPYYWGAFVVLGDWQ
ncbi:MAG: CHAT domain-containing protein, partial [Vicinamibacterales bacterium]